MILPPISPLDVVALAWFIVCFAGYSYVTRFGVFARRRNLVNAIAERRRQWMQEMLTRDPRIMDVQLLANISNGNAFFASTSVIVLGGLIAMLGSAEDVKARLDALPLIHTTSVALVEAKLVFLAALLVRSFFKFAWAYRLTHYLGIMMGAMPVFSEADRARGEDHAARTARLASLSAEHSNGGLRTIYFAISGIAWFLHPIAFIISTTWVVMVLTRREFRSRALETIMPDERFS